MLTNVNIKNFRGINKIEINNFKTINIFLGKNNCGKTSILEAVFLIIGMSNPVFNISINNFRDYIHHETDGFRLIFKDLDYDPPVEISARDKKNNIRQLEIRPFFSSKNGLQNSMQNKISTNSISDVHDITGLKLNFSINKIKHEAKIEINFQHPVNYNQVLSQKYDESYKATYITPKINNLNLDKRIEKIIVNKKQDLLISSLKNIDPNITSISLGTNGRVYFDINGIDKLIPVNIMGDGVRRILSILTTIIDTKNGIVIIDEIENGLHYSSLFTLWESLLNAAIENNVQIFISSHNYEILKNLNDLVKNKDKATKDCITCYSIKRTQKLIKAYQYNFDDFNNAITEGIEIR